MCTFKFESATCWSFLEALANCFLTIYCMVLFAKASCVSQILTAQAVADDMGTARAVETGVQSWASCHPSNSERDCQIVMKRQKTKLNIPIESILCNGVQVPWISPESWLQFLVRKGLWPVLAGCELHDYDGARANWSEFWRKYEKVNPCFELFQEENVDYANTAAWFVHGDEGRTLKRGALMVTSLQSALGKGYDEKRVQKGQSPQLRVNFAGQTLTTRHVVTTIPKTSYESNPELFYAAMDHTAKSLRNLFVNGFRDPMRGTFRVVLLGVKGDAPYLSKVAHLYRSYNTVAKRGEERGPPKGVCAYCLAGTRGFAYEDLSTDHPCWEPTIAVKLPWLRTPSFIRHCLHDRSDPASFFKSDIWHVVHLGFGRSWVASVIQLILPQLPCANLDEKWDYLTDKYLLWCRRNKKQAHVSKITPYLMSYNEAGGAMGNWRKGALTTNFFKWLVELLGEVCADAQNWNAELLHIAWMKCSVYYIDRWRFWTKMSALLLLSKALRFYGAMQRWRWCNSIRGNNTCFPFTRNYTSSITSSLKSNRTGTASILHWILWCWVARWTRT